MTGSIYATMKTRTLRYIALYNWSLCLLTLAVTDSITMWFICCSFFKVDCKSITNSASAIKEKTRDQHIFVSNWKETE